MGRLPHRLASQARSTDRPPNHLASQGVCMDRLPNRPASLAKSTDCLPSLQVSQVKSMGSLMHHLASQERITVAAGNMAADKDMTMIAGVDKVKARANRCFSHLLLN